MLIRSIYSWIYLLLACAMISIGKIYDERLMLFDFNFGVVFSVLFLLFSIYSILTVQKINVTTSMQWMFLFLSYLLLSPILWSIYSYTEIGLEKYINFVSIVIPIVFLTNKFRIIDVKKFFNILLYLVFFLAFLGAIKLGNSVGRLSVLGGGPIIFARWMLIGVLILFFMKKKKWTNNILIITLVLLSLASGSRGPILSFLLTILVFFVLNFRRSFINVFLVSIFLSILFTLITLNKMDDVGKADRLLTKNKTSKNVRLEFASRSLELVYKYPFGVGIGNWQEYCNQSQPHHLLRHEYPHNLLLEIFVELGILGGLIFLYLLIKSIYFTYKRYLLNKSSRIYPLLFYLQIFLLFNSLFSGSLNDSRLLFVVLAFGITAHPLLYKRYE